MEITYEPFDPEDKEELIQRLWKKVLRYEDPTVMDFSEAKRMLRLNVEGNSESIICVKADGLRAGWFLMNEEDDFRKNLSFFCMKEEGSAIANEALGHIISDADDAVYTVVYQKDVSSESFFEKHGFTVKRMLSPTRMVMEVRR